MRIGSRNQRPATGRLCSLQCFWVVAILLAWDGTALGQLRQQRFDLNPGWNAIFLEVNATPASADELFGSLPIESVWMRASEPIGGEGFLCLGPDDPNCTEIQDTMWRAWYKPGPGAEAMTTLRLIRGGNTYLIKATAPLQLTILGVPTGFSPRFRPGYNLRGFHVVDDPAQTPTLGEYLAPRQSSLTPNIHLMRSDGTLMPVPNTDRIIPGRSYWVPATVDFSYDGPVRIDKQNNGGVEFGSRSAERDLILFNEAGVGRNVTVNYLSSLSVPAQGQPDYAGDVPVSRQQILSGTGGIDRLLQWNELGTHTLAIPPRTGNVMNARQITLGVRRAGLAPASLDVHREGSQYQGLLEITDNAGFRRIIGVTAEVGGSGSVSAASAQSGVCQGHTSQPGLYIGTVRVNRVGWVTAGARLWTNTDANNPEFADLTRCFGGANDGGACRPGRKLCVLDPAANPPGDPALERQALVCEEHTDCPGGLICVPDCPGTLPADPPAACTGFCIGGIHAGDSCTDSAPCEDGVPEDRGVCSADMLTEPLRPTDDEFSFPVLIHLNNLGTYTFLTEVTMRVTEDGLRVLQTPDCPPEQCDQYEGAWIVDGQSFSRRISTAAFAFEDDLTLISTGCLIGGSLSGTILISPTDPLNPFRHEFHPDHDCLDRDGLPLGPGAVEGECFQVARFIEFEFVDTPPDGTDRIEWGDSVFGGTYRETLTGLHSTPLRVEGSFELLRVSSIEKLNMPVEAGVLP